MPTRYKVMYSRVESMPRMTSERFFRGRSERIENLAEVLKWVGTEPTEEELINWISANTSADNEEVVLRNIRFLETIDLIEPSDDAYQTTNKGEVFWQQNEPQVMYEGLEKAVDGFREIAQSIASGRRTIGKIQADLQEIYPDYELPGGVVSKHLDWLISLDLVQEENGEYTIPIEDAEFQVGETYNRWFIHDVLGGERYKGIATPADLPTVLIFTGASGAAYGYEDEFLEDDTFLYTGEGTEGDMTMDSGNEAILRHQEEGESLHLFESSDLPWIVTYLGEYEYVDHREEELPDENGDLRDAFRFHLAPVGGAEIDVGGGSPASLSDDDLFEKAKQSAPSGGSSSGGTSSGGRSYPRSQVVREFAYRMADGVCQGCEEEAPFLDKQGNPFLEVHHLTRRSDGGPDDPENVIALCPNCHKRVHQGNDGDEFNQALREKAERRNERLRQDFNSA